MNHKLDATLAMAIGNFFEFGEKDKYTDFHISVIERGYFDENHNFKVRKDNCKIKLGEKRYIRICIEPENCFVRFYNAEKEPMVYIMEPVKLTETKDGYCFDAVKYLKEHGIDYKLCEKDVYTSRRAYVREQNIRVCREGEYFAGYEKAGWDDPSEYRLTAIFFQKQLILDGEAIREVYIPEFNRTNDRKYIEADHTKTEEFIMSLYDEKLEMTKDEFKQYLLDNDTLGVIIVYTWDGKRYDLINLEREAYLRANEAYKKREGNG